MYGRLCSRDPLTLNRAISLVEIMSFRLEKLKAQDLTYVFGQASRVVAAAAPAEGGKNGRSFFCVKTHLFQQGRWKKGG